MRKGEKESTCVCVCECVRARERGNVAENEIVSFRDRSQLLPLCADRTCIMPTAYRAYQISLKRTVDAAELANASRNVLPPCAVFARCEIARVQSAWDASGIQISGCGAMTKQNHSDLCQLSRSFFFSYASKKLSIISARLAGGRDE